MSCALRGSRATLLVLLLTRIRLLVLSRWYYIPLEMGLPFEPPTRILAISIVPLKGVLSAEDINMLKGVIRNGVAPPSYIRWQTLVFLQN